MEAQNQVRSGMISKRDLVIQAQRSGRDGLVRVTLPEAGRIPHLKVGRRLMFNIEAVRQVLLERATPPTHDRDLQG